MVINRIYYLSFTIESHVLVQYYWFSFIILNSGNNDWLRLRSGSGDVHSITMNTVKINNISWIVILILEYIKRWNKISVLRPRDNAGYRWMAKRLQTSYRKLLVNWYYYCNWRYPRSTRVRALTELDQV